MVDLRTTTRDLYDAADELEADAEAIEEQIVTLEAEAREEHPDGDVPVEKEREYQQLKEQHRQLVGTAETYKLYAAIWSGDVDVDPDQWKSLDDRPSNIPELFESGITGADSKNELLDGSCEFVLSELNGDEFAKVMDTVQAEAARDGTVPDQLGKVESLRYALDDIPENAPSNPGEYPAPIVGELYDALQSITSPPEVEAGNGETLAAAIGEESATPADGADMFSGPTTSPPDGK